MSLSAEQVNELKQAFIAFDANGDGALSKDELRNLFSHLGKPVGDDYIDGIFTRADSNGDGTLDFDEFLSAVSD